MATKTTNKMKAFFFSAENENILRTSVSLNTDKKNYYCKRNVRMDVH